MTRQTRIAPAAIGLTFFAILMMALAAGCADSSSAGGKPNDDFEIRAMIAADRQQMQAMDERLRRIESQIQDLAHSAPAAAEGNAAPATPQAPPSAGAPAVQSVPPSAPGAPIAPSGGEAVPPGAGTVPPGAPPGAAASPGTPVSGTSEGTTIASAPGPEAGGAPPPGEESPAEAGSAAGAAPEGSTNDEGGHEEGATENGNPEAPAPPGASASAGAPGTPAGEEGAPPGGEEVASAPSSSTPENAPAAIPPARWPQDLAVEQASGNSKGGAGKLFRSGLDAMKSRNYSAAVERFGTLQKKYPHSDLTEPAAYFSASALNEMGKYDQAILQYNDLVMRYPSGKYASEALLREAQAFVQINDKVDARLTLQKLVNEHAGTPQADTAGAMMKTLESD